MTKTNRVAEYLTDHPWSSQQTISLALGIHVSDVSRTLASLRAVYKCAPRMGNYGQPRRLYALPQEDDGRAMTAFRRKKGLTDRILVLAAREDGVTAADLVAEGFLRTTARLTARRLEAQGRLRSAYIGDTRESVFVLVKPEEPS